MAEPARSTADYAVFDRLGEAVREALPDEVSPREHAAGKERLVAALDGARKRTRPRHLAAVFAAASLAAAAAIVLFIAFRPPRAELAWRAFGAPLTDEGYAAPPVSGPPATIHFSDGSDVVFAPGSRGRVGAVSRREAHVTLESGHVTARLPPVARVAWIIDAGPFAIAASQGAVDVAWTPGEEVLDVRPLDGRATVRGSLARDGVSVLPGQHLVAEVAQRRIRIDGEDGATAPPRSSVNPMPGAMPEPPDVTDADDASVDPSSPRAEHTARVAWTERVAKGDFDGVLREAQTAGLDATLRSRRLADLTALADAARYRGRVDVARRTLLAIRHRFPGLSDAKTAAFLLGRIADDSDGSPSGALTWYDQYLTEAPQGTFAAEAMGRRMNAIVGSSGRDAARSAAQQYLRKYPHGPYGSMARDLAASPPASP